MANNKKTVVPVIVLVLLLGLMYGITHFNSNGTNNPGNNDDGVPSHPLVPKPDVLAKRWPDIVSHATAPARGNPKTPYTIAEFGDFQCPQCGKARPIIEKMLAKYPDQVNLIFVHRPFPTIHEWAIPAALASEVAATQGKFWPMYDMLYSHQDDLEPGYYGGYASQLGMNKDQFDVAFNTPATKQTVETASNFSDSLGVEETPTLVVHDNVHGTVVIYVGLKPTDPSRITAGAHYIDRDFAAHPPWLAQQQATASAKPVLDKKS